MHKDIDKSKFEFVNVDHKIFDTKFEGKPRSFLSDAMSRFTKNKVNVVATTIVLMVVMLAILVPMLTPKDHTSINIPETKFLPPRVPFIEKLGILDGTIDVNEYEADLTKYILVDPSLGDVEENRLYYPKYDQYNTFSPEFIKSGTLVNRVLIGGNKVPAYRGGTNDIVLRGRENHIIGERTDSFYYDTTSIKIDINTMDENTTLKLYLKPSNIAALLEGTGLTTLDPESIEYYTYLGEVTENGVHEISVPSTVYGKLMFVYSSPEEAGRISFNSVEIINAPDTILYSGYELSQWDSVSMNTFGGSWIRANAEYTVTSFTYYKYNDIFANREATLASIDYDILLAENPGMAESIVYNDPNNHDKGWTFGEDYPLISVLSISGRVTGPDGVEYYNLRVVKNGLLSAGYDSLPYFIFGTDSKGRDLFASVWLALRTSLILGVIVSVINILVGVIWGSISGYFGGRIDFFMERFVEILSSFPGLTVLTILYLKFGAGFMLLLIYLTYSGWISVAGITRIQFYRYRGREYVLASRTLGASNARLIFKHILPNSIGYIITSVILSVPSMIITEASLSFLGFGLGEGAVLDFGLFKLSGYSLGIILYNGEQNMTAPGRFYLVLIPAIVIIIIMIAFNLFGNALRDAMNPSLRGQEE